MDEKRTYISACYYTLENDLRPRFDREKFQLLDNAVPDVYHDEYPECGATENLTCCRCFEDHRFCKCGCEWQRKVNTHTGNIDLIINKHKKRENENTPTL